MVDTFSFVLEGENVNGDFLQFEYTFENAESFSDACNLAEDTAVKILESEDGGHLDIYDNEGKFLNDVEV